ncbi:hypothetical protein S245_036873, partial [Arachis hypogaea]
HYSPQLPYPWLLLPLQRKSIILPAPSLSSNSTRVAADIVIPFDLSSFIATAFNFSSRVSTRLCALLSDYVFARLFAPSLPTLAAL